MRASGAWASPGGSAPRSARRCCMSRCRCRIPTAPALSHVRLALPLTEVRDQLASLRRSAADRRRGGPADRARPGLDHVAASSPGASMPLPKSRAATRQVISRARRTTSAPMRSAPSRACSTARFARSAAARRSSRRIARAWRPSSSGMAEGVLVVNDAGTAAARERRRAPDAAPRRRSRKAGTTSKSSGSRISPRRSARALRAAGRRRVSSSRCQQDLIVVVRSAPVVAESARGAVRRAPRHHRPAPRRSRAARFRRQRLARAADAADRGPRLCRGPARRRRPTRQTRNASSRSSRGTRCGWSAWSATCCGSRDSTPARSRASTCPARSTACSLASKASWSRRSKVARQTVERDDRSETPPRVHGDPAKLHDALRNLLENASNYSPEGSTIVMGASTNGDRRPAHGRRSGTRHPRSRPSPDIRTLLSRGQSPIAQRARPRRHRPGPGHREAPDRAARRPRHRRQPPGAGGDLYD